jgi:hypothetical protein
VNARAAGVVVSAALAASACGGSSRKPPCRASDFEIGRGPLVSEATGQESLPLVLHNRGRTACILDGYPSVALADARGALPFAVSHAGDQMVTDQRPSPIVVQPGAAAFVLLNKYRCDLGDKRSPNVVRLTFPGAAQAQLTLAIAHFHRDLGWCGANDPGSTVTASPFEPTRRATFSGSR